MTLGSPTRFGTCSHSACFQYLLLVRSIKTELPIMQHLLERSMQTESIVCSSFGRYLRIFAVVLS
jgi:hypothetical protein